MGEHIYTVYVHICPNGKRYYGSTKTDVIRRWRNGKGYKGNKDFTNAIEKFGWNNFQHIIVANRLTKDEAKWLEIELMRVWDTTNPDKGYNRIFGDATEKGHNTHEDSRKKQSNAISGENNYWYGKHHSEDTRKKISEANMGENNPGAKSVICITTGRIFSTVKDGAKYYEIKCAGNITRCCQGKLKSAGKLNGQKLVWRYIEIVPIE